MTNSEQREVTKARAYMAHFEQSQERAVLDMVARTMATLVRSARTLKSKRELTAAADELGVSGLSEYVVTRWN